VDDSLNAIEVPPVISVTFKPTGLPSGAVDLEDFAQFLDGLQLALEGVAQYDALIGFLPDYTARPRLTIFRIRESSIICDVIINILSNDSISISTQALLGAAAVTGIGGVGFMFRDAIRDAIKESATGAMKDGIEKAAELALSKTSGVANHLMTSLKAATNSRAANEHDHLPPDLTLRMLPGLRKMAKVGAKQTYGDEGITVAADAESNPETRFNADAQRHIEELAKEALASTESIELVGTIEDPSRRKRRFVLDVPGLPRRDRYIPCYYESRHEELIRELYRNHEYVRVRGEKRYRLYSNSSKPRATIIVSSIEPTRPDGLWAHSAAS
jgi:hypothetical protein